MSKERENRLGYESMHDLFQSCYTTIDEIHKSGWEVYCSSSGNWWYRRDAPGGGSIIQSIPHWVHELIDRAEKRGAEKANSKLKRAMNVLGLKLPKETL